MVNDNEIPKPENGKMDGRIAVVGYEKWWTWRANLLGHGTVSICKQREPSRGCC